MVLLVSLVSSFQNNRRVVCSLEKTLPYFLYLFHSRIYGHTKWTLLWSRSSHYYPSHHHSFITSSTPSSNPTATAVVLISRSSWTTHRRPPPPSSSRSASDHATITVNARFLMRWISSPTRRTPPAPTGMRRRRRPSFSEGVIVWIILKLMYVLFYFFLNFGF